MKTIIAGSRSIRDMGHLVAAILVCPWDITTVISGTATGVDTLGEEWARENGIPVERFPADWNKYGKSAGVIRNRQMAERADALVALWDGNSRGTGHMIQAAHKAGLEVMVYRMVSK